MRAFYDSLNKVDSIFSSKVIILPNNRKKYLEIQRPLIFRRQWYGHQTFKLSDLKWGFSKIDLTNFILSYHFWFRKDCVTSFSSSLFCLLITAEISKIKNRTQRELYFTFNAVLKCFNILM